MAREALERAPPPSARTVNGGRDLAGADRVRAALATLADRHLARREAVALDASHGDPCALLTSLEADVPTLAVAPSGGVAALADAIEGRRIDALHLFCAGTNATLELGGRTLAPHRPSAQERAALARIAVALAHAEERPVVHLYGSTFGTGGEGRAAARALTRALGAGLAATRDDGAGGDAQPEWHIELPAPDGGARLPPGMEGKPKRADRKGRTAEPATREAPRRNPAAPSFGGPMAALDDIPPAAFSLASDPFSLLGGRIALGGTEPRATLGAPHREPAREPTPVARPVVSAPDEHAAAEPPVSAELPVPARHVVANESVTAGGTSPVPPEAPRIAVPEEKVAPPAAAKVPSPARKPQPTDRDEPRKADRQAALAVRALSAEAWFRAEPGVGERPLLGECGAPRLVIDGPRLIFVVPTSAGERRAVADLSRLGIEDASSRLVHAIGTVREDWACLYVEGALAATARLDGAEREWRVPHRGPRCAMFEGELGLSRLYARALTGREALANHRATRGDGKPTGGALWSSGPLTGRAGGGASEEPAPVSQPAAETSAAEMPAAEMPAAETAAPHGPAPATPAAEPPAAAPLPSEPAERAERAGTVAPPGGPLDAGAAPGGAPERSVEPVGDRVRRHGRPLARPDPFGPRVMRVREPPSATPGRGARAIPAPLRAHPPRDRPSSGEVAPSWSVRPGASGLTVGHDLSPVLCRRASVPDEPTGSRVRRIVPAADADRPAEAIAAPAGTGDVPDVRAVRPIPETLPGEGEPSREPAAAARVESAPSAPAVDGDPATPPTDAGPAAARARLPGKATPQGPQRRDGAAAHGQTVLRVAPGEELRLDVTELAGCALVDAIAHWPVAMPDWLSLDAATGIASGTVPARAGGRSERVAVSAANGHGATATLAIVLEIAPLASRAPASPSDPFQAIEAAMRTAADAVPALRALLHAGANDRGDGDDQGATARAGRPAG